MDVVFLDDGDVEIWISGKPVIHGFSVLFRTRNETFSSADFHVTPWEMSAGTDDFGPFQDYFRFLSRETVRLKERIRSYPNAMHYEVQFLTDFPELSGSLEFLEAAVWCPVFKPDPNRSFFLCTFGLDGQGGDFPGGYWPEAFVGKVSENLPRKPFAPAVFFHAEGALAVAPGELFLLSPLGVSPHGLGRALAGNFEKIPAGTCLSTWFVEGQDPTEALHRLGQIFLTLGKRERPDAASSLLLSHLGYWNAYGSYYTELVHPMEEKILLALVQEFRAKNLPVQYFGLDLWYPYKRIGQAREFRPDRRKFPRGLRPIREETGIPFILHLSALSADNAYGTDGSDPAIYEEVAEEVVRQGGIGVWHDWLRTWQFLTPSLLSDPWAAEKWFAGMAKSFREKGLPVLLCMQTMGMVLASTREPNIVSARSFTDHLFSQRLALAKAKAAEPEITTAWTRSVDIWKQNLLVGLVQWAFGLRPFHDLFLSSWHPGFGGEHANEEAILRALSCGPVGFGDAVGQADASLLSRLALSQGLLAQPEHPPVPLWPTLFTETPQFVSVRRAGEASWVYWVGLNLGKEERRVTVESPVPGDFLVWDPLRKELTSDLVTIPPEGLAYRVLLPSHNGLALLGLPDLFVPAPVGLSWQIEWDGKWVWEVGRTDPAPWVVHQGRAVPAENVVRLIRREA